jgi:D-alanyl-D-alanine dipeptidase
MGLIAQDVEKIIPYLIAENENGKSVMYQNMIGLLVQAIKELKQEIDRLKGDNK